MVFTHIYDLYMTIKLITFDLDDTLWPCMPTIARTEEKLHQWFSQFHPYVSNHYSIEQLRQQRQSISLQYPHIAHDLSAIRKQSFSQLAEEMHYSTLLSQHFVQAAFDYYFQQRNHVNLYDDVLPTLNILKKNYLIGAVSNGNADIHLVGLSDFFDFSWSAVDAGKQKPHPIVFESLLKSQHVVAHEVIHIGDDPKCDIYAAQQANIQAIWLNRDHKKWPNTINTTFNTAFIEIDQLIKLPSLIKTL